MFICVCEEAGVWECRYPWMPEELGPPGSEIVASYEPPSVDAGDPIQVLQQQWTLLSADSSLQPSLKYVLSYCAITRKNASMAILEYISWCVTHL